MTDDLEKPLTEGEDSAIKAIEELIKFYRYSEKVMQIVEGRSDKFAEIKTHFMSEPVPESLVQLYDGDTPLKNEGILKFAVNVFVIRLRGSNQCLIVPFSFNAKAITTLVNSEAEKYDIGITTSANVIHPNDTCLVQFEKIHWLQIFRNIFTLPLNMFRMMKQHIMSRHI